jgi:hypothetical protein
LENKNIEANFLKFKTLYFYNSWEKRKMDKPIAMMDVGEEQNNISTVC